MASAVRVGDVFVGTCCCHPPIPCVGMSGVIVSGASNVTIENSSASRIGDVGVGYCGHATVLVSGSGVATTVNSANSRIGDAVAGCIVGAMATGASKTDIGE